MGWMANKIKSKCLIPLQKDYSAATIAVPLLVAHHIHQAWTWPYNAILCCKLKMLPAPKISPHYMVGLITMCWFACQLKTEGVPAGNLPMILTAMKTMNAMIHTYKDASASLDCVSAFGLYDDAPARSCGKSFIRSRRDMLVQPSLGYIISGPYVISRKCHEMKIHLSLCLPTLPLY